MSVVMISTFSVKDQKSFQSYLSLSKQLASEYNAELVLRGQLTRVLNGKGDNAQRVVIARFPSQEKVDGWFDSPKYAELVSLRERAADMTMLTYEELT